jgi:6-phosphogluconolactonase
VIELSVHPTPEDAARAAAELVAAGIADAQSARGAAHVSLAGGTTPKRAYELLGPEIEDPSRVDWWFGDERCVPPDDPESNFRLVAESLLASGRIPAERIHRIRGEDPPRSAAVAYEADLRAAVAANAAGIPTLDIALLGLGEDGHTASLFPDDAALDVTDALALPVVGPKPPPDRITLTLPVFLAARQVMVLTTGSGKQDAVGRVLAGPDRAVPASLLAPGDVLLVIDEAARP